MNEITTEQALRFVSWLAQLSHGEMPMPKPFTLTDIQIHVHGITDIDVWLANVSCNFRGGWAYDDGGIFHGNPCPPQRAEKGDVLIGWNDGAGREVKRRNFTDTEIRCFDRLRDKYHVLMRSKRADDPDDSQHEARSLVHGMVIDDSVARRDMKQIVMDYLTEASKNAERELLEAAVIEEENKKKKSGSKKSKCRAKQKRKKSKTQQRHDDQDTLTVENRDQKECRNGGTSSQTEQQECSTLHPSTAESKSNMLSKEVTQVEIEPSVPTNPRPVEKEDRVCPNKDGPITEECSTRTSEPSTESLAEEIAQLKLSVQQVQLKSYIAETARESAEERAAWLEGVLLDTIEERVLNEVTRCEIIDAIGVLASSGPKSAG